MAHDEFRRIAGLIHDADRYNELFTGSDESAVKTKYRTMTKIVHPDLVEHDRRSEAGSVMAKLTSFYDEALKAIKDGTFGVPIPVLVLQTSDFRHDCLTKRSRWFDIAVGFEARTTSPAGAQDSLVKIAAQPRDNDLMAVEADALKALANTGVEHAMYYPTLLDSSVVRDGRRRLRANVLARLDGFVNLEQVVERYPAGIHPLDMGWMWRRVLWALGGAHEAGMLHGALVPSHIMIHPTLHGVVLVDWCYSLIRSGEDYPAMSAVVGQYRDWYPEAMLNRKVAPTEALDLALAARSMLKVMGAQSVPSPMLSYFNSLADGDSKESAYELLGQFDRILERLGAPYYPRSYRPFNW